MMVARPMGLGIIPDYLFSPDPRINTSINPHVQIPPEWSEGQRTVQPIGYTSPRTHGDPLAITNGLTQMGGLGLPIARWHSQRAGLGAIDMFDSWAWRNRKWLILGGVGLLGLGVLSGVGALLR